MVPWWLGVFLSTIFSYLIWRWVTKEHSHPLPPGPKPLPLIGNIFDMPSTKPWLTFADWIKFGDVSHIHLFQKHIVVLNSINAAVEMLEKKSSKYSDRPILPMTGILVGCEDSLGLLRPGTRHREARRQFHRVIGTHAALEAFHGIQIAETHNFLKRVYESPERLSAHIRRQVGSVILRISHGYEVLDDNDPFVNNAENALLIFAKTSTQGAYLVDVLPILQYIPKWFPGAGFKVQAQQWKEEILEMVNQPHEYVKSEMAAGTARRSFSSALLDNPSLTEEEEHAIKWSAASFYGAGADTTVSAMYAFFLAMTLFPDVQKKAQAQIDAVIGVDRLPTFADRGSLPYVEAVVKEVLRWHTVTPLGMPHVASEDDIHDGYYIPKGAVVIANVWFMLHDPRTYSDPMEFLPDRFLSHEGKEPELDPRTIAFGFGRRICPGLRLADNSLWLLATTSLAVFTISKAIEGGVEITPEYDCSPHTISHIKPFKCAIRPRSARALDLIQQDVYY